MQLFYAPDIETNATLPETESQHCIKVLRMGLGDIIDITDGKGSLYKGAIISNNHKRCEVKIVEKTAQDAGIWSLVDIAIAPTKNNDRVEWFAEKSTEIGINKIWLIGCRFSERKEMKPQRIERVVVSAMKQSLKATKPQVEEMLPFKTFISQPFDGVKYIAHCNQSDNKKLLKDIYQKGTKALIMIGPEGDFSPEEVEMAKQAGCVEITLGDSRLRTETAALVACHTINLINQ